MRTKDLIKEGIPKRIVKAWEERQGETLLSVQQAVVEQGLLDMVNAGSDSRSDCSNMIISAPTSTGKSFCAEMAAVKALTNRQKAVLLFPLKSLAEEKYRLFRSTYEDFGIKTIIVTGDRTDSDGEFAGGDYQVAITIYEKFDRLLTLDLDVLHNIGLVMVDEIQMLAEPGRGAVLERLLTKIVVCSHRPSILALSAVLDDSSSRRLSGWLSAKVVRERQRPVDLLRGVAAESSLHLRSFNTSEEMVEPFKTPPVEDDPTDCLVNFIRADSGSTLLFLKSRQDTINMAFRLASSMAWPSAESAIERLKGEESSYLVRSLRQTLRHGVAFHNSDLTPKQRCAVEQAFVDGEIKALCSTTTLSLGVNLPADTVFLETVRYCSGRYESRPQLVPITRAEFDNMSGRAGRLGMDGRQPGRAIILAQNEFDRDILWNTYIAPEAPDPLRSAAESLSAEDWVLNVICSGLAHTAEGVDAVMAGRFCALENGDCSQQSEPIVASLVDSGLLLESTESGLTAGPFGRAVALAGLSCAEGIYYRRLLDHAWPRSAFGWTALALSSPGWALPVMVLSRLEHSENLPLRMLNQRPDFSPEEVACLFPPSHDARQASYRQAATLKVLLLLDDWRHMMPARELEERYQVHLGQILSLGETAAHLVSALARLIGATTDSPAGPSHLHDLAFSLRFGLVPDLKPLCDHLDQALNRGDFIALYNAGVSRLSDLADFSSSERERLISDKYKLRIVNDILSQFKEEVDMVSARAAGPPVAIAEPESVEVIGTMDRERFLVRINGLPVPLTGKSFKYFVKLAWSRLTDESGWMYKEDIEVGFNQARYLYRMKNEIAAGFDAGWPIIENNRLGYYRLQVDPSKIRMDRTCLERHPDWEIRSLFVPADSSRSVS